jgi:hypothetical protein
MYDYENLKNTFKEKKCTLLSTKEEIQEYKKNPKVKFTASCGHENFVFVNVFLSRNTGVVCKNCLAKRYKNAPKPTINYFEQEYNGFLKLKSYIQNDFDIEKMCDGASVDYAIKRKNSDDNLYLALQIKVTNTTNNNIYPFRIHKKYKDIIIICIQLHLELFWIIDGNINIPRKLNITYKKGSKYDIYKTSKEDLALKLLEIYATYKLHPLVSINCPVSVAYQKEREFRLLRENNVNLAFQYPTYEGLVYDFKVENLKFQERLAHTHRNGYCCQFAKNKGRKSQNYIKGDNDFYWIHIPDRNYFYVIPEYEFLKHNIVSYTKCDGSKSLMLYPNANEHKHSWTNKYLFEYKKVNLTRLEMVIYKDYTECEEEDIFTKMSELWL